MTLAAYLPRVIYIGYRPLYRNNYIYFIYVFILYYIYNYKQILSYAHKCVHAHAHTHAYIHVQVLILPSPAYYPPTTPPALTWCCTQMFPLNSTFSISTARSLVHFSDNTFCTFYRMKNINQVWSGRFIYIKYVYMYV